jgi:hypothetical protein
MYSPTTYKVSDVTMYVKRVFGDESAVQLTDDDICRWINAAQREILTTNKVLKALATADLLNGVFQYTFPSQNILEVQSILINNRKMDYRSFQEAEEYIIKTDPDRVLTGDPTMWYEWGGVFYIYPTPTTDSPAGIQIFYVNAPTTVTVPTDLLSLPDSFFNRIVEYCLSQAYEMDEDSQNSQYKLGQFAKGLDVMSNAESMMGNDTYPRITVLEDDQ